MHSLGKLLIKENEVSHFRYILLFEFRKSVEALDAGAGGAVYGEDTLGESTA